MRFVHLLLFQCPDCKLPVSAVRISVERNLEGIDAGTIEVDCSYCDTLSDVSAISAIKHYVEESPN
jgi:hypothetical protein